MKEIKLSFPYPSTSRHNLSQDVAMSISMGLVMPVRVLEVLPGDSHRIGTSFSLISNPLVKPLLQGVRMRYCRFWVPSRIYNIDQRANNTDFDPRTVGVRPLQVQGLKFPISTESSDYEYMSNFQASSLFDCLGYASAFDNLILTGDVPQNVSSSYPLNFNYSNVVFNAEPYLAYVDICRNYFGDSATNMIAWSDCSQYRSGSDIITTDRRYVCVSPLTALDEYIDKVQNSRGLISPYDFSRVALDHDKGNFTPFILNGGRLNTAFPVPVGPIDNSVFSTSIFGVSHVGFCVPMLRPDRLSRLFNTEPLTSQNAIISPSEISIANLSFLAKMQKYLTRRFFGGSRFTDVMYSVFGQNVPHVDSPVLLDVFDQEIGSELVASTNATESQNPGVLGGYFSASGNLTTSRGRYKKRYSFNERGYLIDLVYVMPRIYRDAFLSDFYPLVVVDSNDYSNINPPMQQANFIPDMNGIGWQQPSFVNGFRSVHELTTSSNSLVSRTAIAFCCEPSWQQHRTLPDVSRGLLNPIRGIQGSHDNFQSLNPSTVNSPLFVFSDRMNGFSFYNQGGEVDAQTSRYLLASQQFFDFNYLNSVFGFNTLTFDNLFVVFRYAHQAKRQVTKRFTLNFN